MLVYLHVKNLALIEEEEIEFEKGLNILSGETGAGKSIILGALHLALGEKVPQEMLRDETKPGIVEATFTITDDEERKLLEEMDISYDDEVILSRKITESRSVAKINGEVVPADKLKLVGSHFIDIYGQSEHQSLANKKKHLMMLDEYGKAEIEPVKEDLKEIYSEYTQLKNEYENACQSNENRDRDIEIIKHTIEEIQTANIRIGEDEELEEQYNLLSNSEKIVVGCNEAYNNTANSDGVSDKVARAIRSLKSVEDYDSRLSEYSSMLEDVDSIISDFNREISSYITDMDFDDSTFTEIESRLNLLNSLKQKYGPTLSDVMDRLDSDNKRLEQLEDYDKYLEDLKNSLNESENKLNDICDKLTEIRKKYSYDLLPKVRSALGALNFLDVEFDMYFTRLDKPTSNGIDEAEFIISTNPGEPMKPLKNIASGGEMSRIMLALKTVLATADLIDTMIFDEIDAGISGRTAQALSEKLSVVAKDKQVICITHLPQVAAMADKHFLIEKHVEGTKTISSISDMTYDDRVEELARMLSGSNVTETVMANARELLDYAKNYKNNQ
ncbi:MAG: DNA repair protein RecN [Lachnospiraceae bacterium]|nr:DNA repair protein RecN [Lachnospiraceae bacterium]